MFAERKLLLTACVRRYWVRRLAFIDSGPERTVEISHRGLSQPCESQGEAVRRLQNKKRMAVVYIPFLDFDQLVELFNKL